MASAEHRARIPHPPQCRRRRASRRRKGTDRSRTSRARAHSFVGRQRSVHREHPFHASACTSAGEAPRRRLLSDRERRRRATAPGDGSAISASAPTAAIQPANLGSVHQSGHRPPAASLANVPRHLPASIDAGVSTVFLKNSNAGPNDAETVAWETRSTAARIAGSTWKSSSTCEASLRPEHREESARRRERVAPYTCGSPRTWSERRFDGPRTPCPSRRKERRLRPGAAGNLDRRPPSRCGAGRAWP